MHKSEVLLLQACKFITENLAISTDTLGKDALKKCATTSMSSKIIGAESDFFSTMAVDAMQAIKSSGPDGKVPPLLPLRPHAPPLCRAAEPLRWEQAAEDGRRLRPLTWPSSIRLAFTKQ